MVSDSVTWCEMDVIALSRSVRFHLRPGIHASCYLRNESADAALISEQRLVITRNIPRESRRLDSF